MEKAQDYRCACGCGQPLSSGPVEEEHYRPVAFNGQAKPDALWLKDCHLGKTAKDRKAIAKAKRIAGETRSQWNGTNRGRGRIEGRGFEKRKAPYNWPKRKVGS